MLARKSQLNAYSKVPITIYHPAAAQSDIMPLLHYQYVFLPAVVTLGWLLVTKQDSQRSRRSMHSIIKLMLVAALSQLVLSLLLVGNHLAEVNRSSDINEISMKADIYNTSQVQVSNHYGTHAIFLISFGEQAADSTLVERCVLSLRRRGQWTGYIVLLTDASPSRYEDWDEENNVIVMHPREEHFNGAGGKPLEFNRETLSLKVKRFKTYVLDYVDMDKRLNKIEVIYYLDIDIIAGNKLEHLFRSKQQMIESPHQLRGGGGGGGLSTLHFFTPISSEYPFQSGTFVVKRTSSRHCLELWRREIENIAGGTLGMDQAALRTIHDQIKAGFETKCRLIRMDNEDFLSFLKPKNFNKISKLSSYTTLIHLSNSKFAKWMDEEQQNTFLHAVLQLSEEEIQSGKYGKSIIKLT